MGLLTSRTGLHSAGLSITNVTILHNSCESSAAVSLQPLSRYSSSKFIGTAGLIMTCGSLPCLNYRTFGVGDSLKKATMLLLLLLRAPCIEVTLQMTNS